jgi:hypothetical protein
LHYGLAIEPDKLTIGPVNRKPAKIDGLVTGMVFKTTH